MKKVAFAILAIMLMCFAAIPTTEADANSTETVKMRMSDYTLYYAEATASQTFDITYPYVYIYEKGHDDSMRAYIDDPDHLSTPGRPLKHINEGTTYAIYYVGHFQYDDEFNHPSFTSVLESYGEYKIAVEDGTAVKVKASSAKTFEGRDSGAFILRTYDKSLDYSTNTYPVGSIATLNYDKDIPYYGITPYDDDYSLFVDIKASITLKEFTDSPYRYVVLCTIVTILVGITIAVCGRKPKF
ncbi:MAG: hypothetical protein E7Z64_04575 [Thermoplasmata archaeon]|nr:hypothetical protein [Thermoplasmata archaeon]